MFSGEMMTQLSRVSAALRQKLLLSKFLNDFISVDTPWDHYVSTGSPTRTDARVTKPRVNSLQSDNWSSPPTQQPSRQAAVSVLDPSLLNPLQGY